MEKIIFFELLQLLFIGLKVTGLVDWHWPIVFLPMLAPLGILLLLCAFFALNNSIERWKKCR